MSVSRSLQPQLLLQANTRSVAHHGSSFWPGLVPWLPTHQTTEALLLPWGHPGLVSGVEALLMPGLGGVQALPAPPGPRARLGVGGGVVAGGVAPPHPPPPPPPSPNITPPGLKAA